MQVQGIATGNGARDSQREEACICVTEKRDKEMIRAERSRAIVESYWHGKMYEDEKVLE